MATQKSLWDTTCSENMYSMQLDRVGGMAYAQALELPLAQMQEMLSKTSLKAARRAPQFTKR